jgi:hypothetical protein
VIECLLADTDGEPNRGEIFDVAGEGIFKVAAVLENDGRFVRVSVKEVT